MWRRERARSDREAGFTLVEALAALAVMAVGLAAIGALANTSLRSSLKARGHLLQTLATQTIVADLPGRNALPLGRLTGVLDDHAWRLDNRALPTTEARPSAEWSPQGITLLVRSPSGALTEVETIRLRRNERR